MIIMAGGIYIDYETERYCTNCGDKHPITENNRCPDCKQIMRQKPIPTKLRARIRNKKRRAGKE